MVVYSGLGKRGGTIEREFGRVVVRCRKEYGLVKGTKYTSTLIKCEVERKLL